MGTISLRARNRGRIQEPLCPTHRSRPATEGPAPPRKLAMTDTLRKAPEGRNNDLDHSVEGMRTPQTGPAARAPATGPSEATDGNQPVRIDPVEDSADRERFLDVPERVFADDPAWIPPLRAERRAHLSRRSNPFFRHADARFWTAWRDGVPVGRISAQVDHLHLEHHGEACGFFGMLDAVDDPAVFAALLGTAEGWLRNQGMERVRGPFNLCINDECGLLVGGFEHPPRLLMGHDRPYFNDYLEACGYHPSRDLLAYRLPADFTPSPTMSRLQSRFGKRLAVRPLRRMRMGRELATLRSLFNEAWAGNWGFVPFTQAEFAQLGGLFRFLVPRDWIQIAEVDGEPAGMIVLLPDINEAIADLGGRPGLRGGLRLLKRLARLEVKRGRLALMGIRPHLQGTALGAATAYRMIADLHAAALDRGLEEVELSWILEENEGMRHIIEDRAGAPYKRYRILEKALA